MVFTHTGDHDPILIQHVHWLIDFPLFLFTNLFCETLDYPINISRTNGKNVLEFRMMVRRDISKTDPIFVWFGVKFYLLK